MSPLPLVGEAIVRVRVTSDRLGNDIGDAVRRGFANANRDIDQEGTRAGRRAGDRFNAGARDRVNRNRELRRDVGRVFGGLASVAGAAGSVVGRAFLLEAGTALAASAVALGAALGPGLAGAAGVGTAALASLGLSAGLLALAFKSDVAGVQELKDRFGELGQLVGRPIAESMLGGMNLAVDRLKGAIPALTDSLHGIGDMFGLVAAGLADTFTTPENLSRLNGILDMTRGFIGNLGAGLANLGTSFLILWNAARPFVDFVGQGLVAFSQWARSSLEAAEANGSLAGFMTGLLDKFRQLWDIVKNVGTGIMNIFKAAAPSGATILTSVQGIAAAFAAWTGDSANQARMSAFFETARVLAGKLLDAIGKIAAGMGGGLVAAFTGLAGPLGIVSDKINAFASSEVGNKILGVLGPIIALAGPLSSLVGPISTLVELFAGLSSAVLAPVAGIAALVVAFVAIYTQSEKFRTAIGGLLSVVGGAFAQVWDVIGPKLEAVGGKLLVLAQVIGDRLAPVITWLGPIVANVVTFIGGLLGTLIDIFGGVIDLITALISGNWSAAWDACKAIVQGVITFLGQLWDGFVAYLSAVWSIISGAAQAAWNGISAAASAIWGALVAAVQSIVQGVADWLAAAWANVQATASAIWSSIAGIASAIWSGLVAAVQAIVQGLVGGLSAAWSAISGTASSIWSSITGIASSIWSGITSTISGIANGLIGTLQGIWDSITRAISSAWNGVSGVVSGVWNGISSAITGPVNTALGIVQSVVGTITGVVQGAIDLVGRLVSAITSVPDVPNPTGSGVAGGAAFGGISKLFTQSFYAHYDPPVALAGGGIVRATPGGVHAILAEGGRSERVEPLDRNGLSARDRGLIEAIVRSTADAFTSGDATGRSDVRVYLDSQEIAGVVATVVTEHDRQLARRARNARRTG